MEYESLHDFAKEVAREMGWHYDAYASTDHASNRLWHFAVIKPGLTEFSVHIREDWRKPLYYQITGHIPTQDKVGENQWTYSGKIPKIHVRKDRGSVVVGQEVKRRLLLPYQKAYTEAKAVLNSRNAHLDRMTRIAAQFAPYGEMNHQRYNRGEINLNFGGKVQVTSDGVDLSLNVSEEMALRIVEMVAQIKA